MDVRCDCPRLLYFFKAKNYKKKNTPVYSASKYGFLSLTKGTYTVDRRCWDILAVTRPGSHRNTSHSTIPP